MIRKFRIYLSLISILAISAGSFIILNSAIISRSNKLIHLENMKHRAFHHFMLGFKEAQEELYRFEAGYGHDLDNLVEEVETSESMLNYLIEIEKNGEFKRLLLEAMSDFQDYKIMVSGVITSQSGEQKRDDIHRVSEMGYRIGKKQKKTN